MNETRSRRSARRPRAGFSLIEVALALIVAAGGLLAIFGVFPVSLRQSANSRADMGQMTFAATVLETIAGNIRTIDRISVWNDPEQFWNVAVGDTGLPSFSEGVSGADMYQQYQSAINEGDTAPFSPATTYVAETWSAQPNTDEMNDLGENIWYFGEEKEETPSSSNKDKIAKPAQYLIRLAVVRRYARPKGGGAAAMEAAAVDNPNEKAAVCLPNVYVVSVVSSNRGYPDVYIREPLYSQEFTFIHRP